MYYDIFVGVDGSGPYSNLKYSAEFSSSFVKQLSELRRFGSVYYKRGPGLDGLRTGMLAKDAAQAAENLIKVAPKFQTPRLFLAGYSRGGAAIVESAHVLKEKNIPVHGMLLFDAVDRSGTIDKTLVPANVTYACHAMRDPLTNSRSYFGNCGTQIESGVDLFSSKFFTTHGGMGGTPFGVKSVVEGKINEGSDTASDVLNIAKNISPALTILNFANTSTFQTNVTPEQEEIGSKAVWIWMLRQLETMARMPPKGASW